MSPEPPPPDLDVLIAEDDGDIRFFLRTLLESQGYRCAEAEDGRIAVEIARRCPPRVILLDLMMPNVDGWTAAKQLRADPQTHDVPIHCVTALNFPAARDAAHEAGCDGYLTKPVSPEEILEVVRAALDMRRAGGSRLTRGVERLEQALVGKVPGRERNWVKEVDTALNDLEAAMHGHTALLGALGGPADEVDLTSPTLVRQAAQLRRQHADLLGRVGALRARVRGAGQAFQAPAGLAEPHPAGSVVDFSALRRTGQELVTALKRHAEAERSLLFESVGTDIGVGD
jgi:two-component system cell cycle response regulator DivK